MCLMWAPKAQRRSWDTGKWLALRSRIRRSKGTSGTSKHMNTGIRPLFCCALGPVRAQCKQGHSMCFSSRVVERKLDQCLDRSIVEFHIVPHPVSVSLLGVFRSKATYQLWHKPISPTLESAGPSPHLSGRGWKNKINIRSTWSSIREQGLLLCIDSIITAPWPKASPSVWSWNHFPNVKLPQQPKEHHNEKRAEGESSLFSQAHKTGC